MSAGPGAVELYQAFLNDYNKLVEPSVRRHLIYSGGHYFIQTGTFIQLLERDPYFLELVANIVQKQKQVHAQNEQLEIALSIIERLLKVIERLTRGNKKYVRFSL